ncbi:MAG: fumarylacetoacetate hydrolase family protein [Anaerolineae bacterium]|nr:fumarylacetoacetate hydrolase family protein [Anaerolineae bacterium]
MRLVTFYDGDTTRLGALRDDRIIDLAAAAPSLPTTLLGLLQSEATEWRKVGAALTNPDAPSVPLAATRLAAPIPRPPKIMAIGLNYRDHAAETGATLPQRPIVFAKYPTSVIGPGDAITWSTDITEQVDYEAELCVVIGRPARQVSVEAAMGYVAGYMCGNDVSARDVQSGHRSDGGQWVRGKSQDTFCPLGPMLVTRDEVADPGALGIRCLLNGQPVQESTTSNLIFDVPSLVSFLSHNFTLEPGDVIMTGTPPGVGAARKPPLWLKPGDTVAIEIDGLGRLENPVR